MHLLIAEYLISYKPRSSLIKYKMSELLLIMSINIRYMNKFWSCFRHLTVEWKAGVLACKIFKFAQMFSLYLSAYIMVLIGVDRFIGKLCK